MNPTGKTPAKSTLLIPRHCSVPPEDVDPWKAPSGCDRLQLAGAQKTARPKISPPSGKEEIELLIRRVSQGDDRGATSLLRRTAAMRTLGQMPSRELWQIMQRCDAVPEGTAANGVYQKLQNHVAGSYLTAFSTDLQLLLAPPLRNVESHLRNARAQNATLALMRDQPEQFLARLNALGIDGPSADVIKRSLRPEKAFRLALVESRRALQSIGHLARNMLHDDSHAGYFLDNKPLADRARQLVRDFRLVDQRTRQRLGIRDKSAASSLIGQLLVRGKQMQQDAQLRQAILKTTLSVVASLGGFGVMGVATSVAYGAATTTLGRVPELLIKSERATVLRTGASIGVAPRRKAEQAQADVDESWRAIIRDALSGGAIGGTARVAGQVLSPVGDALLKGSELIYSGQQAFTRNMP